MSHASAQSIRRYVLTGSVAAITATGAWYGAGLKARQEFKQERQTTMEATPAQKIAQLETMRAKLIRQKTDLQNTIDRLSAQSSNEKSGSTG